LPQLFAKILFQQMPQGLSNAVNWIQSELLAAMAVWCRLTVIALKTSFDNPATGGQYWVGSDFQPLHISTHCMKRLKVKPWGMYSISMMLAVTRNG
jgi:hypothetical protein